jgi:hypothetical protein
MGEAAGQQAPAETSPRSAVSLRRYFLPVAAAAALLLAVALWPLLLQKDGTAGTGLVEVYFLDSTVRAAEPEVLEVPAGAGSFTLFLQVDLLPEELPLDVELLDVSGDLLYQGMQGTALVRDTFVVIHCRRSDFPDGDYTARVRSQASDGTGWTEYAFQGRSAS